MASKDQSLEGTSDKEIVVHPQLSPSEGSDVINNKTTSKSEVKDSADSMRKVVTVVAFYWTVSFTVVFMNKYLLSTSVFHFPYPLTITYYQLFVSLVIFVCISLSSSSLSIPRQFPTLEFNTQVAQKIFPLTVVYVAMLATNNASLKYIEVTFYNVVRKLAILFSSFLTYLILKKTVSKRVMISLAIIVLGFVFGSIGEVRLSWAGMILGTIASFCVALYGIYVKKTLPIVDEDQWKLLYYNTVLSLFFMLPFIYLTGEFDSMLSKPNVISFLNEPVFWFTQTITGIAGFLVNVAIFLQIKVTTPLTNVISGTAKSTLQVFLAWLLFQNPITPMNFVGIVVSLWGSAWYSWIRYTEIRDRL